MGPWSFNISKENMALCVVLAAAFFFRVWGITHDLPYNYYPDERHFINRSLAFGSGDLNPHWFHKPSLYMYILFFEYGAYFVIGGILGWFASIDDFARHYFSDPSLFFIIGRMTTALFGVATVYLVYLIGRDYGKERIGLLAALFLAVTFGHVRSSHFVLTDVPTTFFTALSFLYLAKITETGKTRNYMLAGLFAGLGTATKYYSVILVPCLFLAHFLFHWRQGSDWWKKTVNVKIIGGVAAWGFGFFAGSPYNFLDPFWFKTAILPMFIGTGRATAAQSVFESDRLGSFLLAIPHIGGVLLSPTGMGFILGLLALAGVGYLGFRHSVKDLVLLSVPLTFILTAAYLAPFYAKSRHLNPIYPFLCLAAAIVMDKVLAGEWLKKRSWVVGLLCFVVVLPSGYQVFKFDYRISQKETRTHAKEWIEANIPPGTNILLDEHGPPLNNNRENLVELYQRAKQQTRPGPFTTHLERYVRYQLATVSGITYDITQIHHAWWKKKEEMQGSYTAVTDRDLDFGNPMRKRGVMPLEYYRSHGYEFFITTSEDYETYLEEPRKTNFPSTSTFYRDIFKKGVLVKEFRADRWYERGPVVKIFKL